MTRRVTLLIAMLPCLLAASSTLAHTGDVVGGFVGGLKHPVFGPDHVAAMVAVGLWGAFLGPPAIFLLPVVFPLVMALGGALGILGVPLPGTEIGIAISALLLGLAVVLAIRPPMTSSFGSMSPALVLRSTSFAWTWPFSTPNA